MDGDPEGLSWSGLRWVDEGRRGVEGLGCFHLSATTTVSWLSVCPSPGALPLHTIWQRESLSRTAEGCVPKGLCRWGKREGGDLTLWGLS